MEWGEPHAFVVHCNSIGCLPPGLGGVVFECELSDHRHCVWYSHLDHSYRFIGGGGFLRHTPESRANPKTDSGCSYAIPGNATCASASASNTLWLATNRRTCDLVCHRA